ncbi:MAG: flagellar assembly protein FliW [candidate division Zixibacteria bacterium]|nr:flagellar assembly protein FliW [candidate division Zixibacteria bacterium]
MRISTLRFGEFELPEDKIIEMPKPILGFEHLKRYCIIEREESEPFLWYQAVDDPAIAFIIVNPLFFCPNYHIEVNPKEIEELRIADVKAVETYVIVTIPSDPQRISANMQGPILINVETRLAKQLILVNSEYDVRYYLLPEKDQAAKTTIVEEPAESLVTI